MKLLLAYSAGYKSSNYIEQKVNTETVFFYSRTEDIAIIRLMRNGRVKVISWFVYNKCGVTYNHLGV